MGILWIVCSIGNAGHYQDSLANLLDAVLMDKPQTTNPEPSAEIVDADSIARALTLPPAMWTPTNTPPVSDTQDTVLNTFLPCPFCGGTNIWMDKFSPDSHSPECNSCGATIVSKADLSYDAALAAWNRRTVNV